MTTDDLAWPTALVLVSRMLIDYLGTQCGPATRIEIRFGPGALEATNRALLRTVTGVMKFDGVPVAFPEEPGLLPFGLQVRAIDRHGCTAQGCLALEVAALDE